MPKVRTSYAGGWRYHARAWIYRKRYWVDVRQWVAFHLDRYLWDAKEITIVGASGGWLLPDKFVNQFARIDIFDLDPLAKRIFQWRFPNVRVNWHHEDFFGESGRRLATRLHANQILFSNVLGQLAGVYAEIWSADDSAQTQFEQNLQSFLKQHPRWASFHDVYSLPFYPNLTLKPTPNLETYVKQLSGKVSVTDHHTLDWIKTIEGDLQPWRLSETRLHLLGWSAAPTLQQVGEPPAL